MHLAEKEKWEIKNKIKRMREIKKVKTIKQRKRKKTFIIKIKKICIFHRGYIAPYIIDDFFLVLYAYNLSSWSPESQECLWLFIWLTFTFKLDITSRCLEHYIHFISPSSRKKTKIIIPTIFMLKKNSNKLNFLFKKHFFFMMKWLKCFFFMFVY